MTRFAVGIDLGTTQSALAYQDLAREESGQENGQKNHVELLPIPQLVAASTVEPRPTLPSMLYLTTDGEISTGATDLPWSRGQDFVVGEWARRQAADVPTRTVAAAKSWLCHSRVDRRDAILPWQAPEGVPRISPVTVTQRYLEHLVATWRDAFPGAPLADQHVVLTVPASFDAAARELTREAALAAGLPTELVLLEEPQAAVYAWLDGRGDAWRRELSEGDRVLVTDVGGGTTDFSLIGVEAQAGELALRRIAVGDHILVGGDNMDLTLAHHARQAFAEKGVEVDPWQAVGLWHACRQAKETLMAEDGPETHPVTVLGRGRKLIGGTVSVHLERDQIRDTLIDGFFPLCAADARPARRRASGFREIGLPFESDTAVSHHLASFLNQHVQDAGPPTHLLVNGGVFKAAALRQRLASLLGSWYGGSQYGDSQGVKPLHGHHDLDFAVARGAAAYARTKHQGGMRIRGGTARSYYIGIETAGLAIPGAPRPLSALCVVPRGTEEGSRVEVPSGEIGLVVGETVPFRFFSSTTRDQDQVGDVLDRWPEGVLVETDSLEASLPPPDASADSFDTFVPVRLSSHITELGSLELWCLEENGNGRWKMEFSVREDAIDQGTF